MRKNKQGQAKNFWPLLKAFTAFSLERLETSTYLLANLFWNRLYCINAMRSIMTTKIGDNSCQSNFDKKLSYFGSFLAI